jgi:hypothetical protein
VKALQQARPDITLETIAGCGHFVHVFAGEQVRLQLQRWLAGGAIRR